MKKFSKLVALLLCLCVAFSTVACGNNQDKQNADVLDIYVLHTGYGHDWADILGREFLKQDWVKEKYPKLKVNVEFNDMTGYLGQQMQLGKASKYDLLFAAYAFGYQGNPNVVDLTQTVYNTKVPGEDVLFKDKMHDNIYSTYSQIVGNEVQNTAVPFNMGSYSIFYNETMLNALAPSIGKTVDNVVPVTTDELFSIMKSVKTINSDPATRNQTYPYEYTIMGANNGYCYSNFSTWWAQYEGLQDYINFYHGVVEHLDGSTMQSRDVIRQQGRLEALKIMEECFKYDNGYYYPKAADMTYITSQMAVWAGEGLFHFNGDYLGEEMKPYYAGLTEEYGEQIVKYMKLPVISSIIDRLPSVKTAAAANNMTNDEMLAKLIRDIDKDIAVCEVEGVTPQDYTALIEARKMISITSGQCGIMPTWSTSQEAAADFLRFMATDIANAAVTTGTGGLMMPFEYDYKENNPEEYKNLLPSQKDKIDALSNKVIPAVFVNPGSCYPLGKAGLTPLKSIEYNGKVVFEQVFGEKGTKSTAQTVFETDAAYWTQEQWENLVALAAPYL